MGAVLNDTEQEKRQREPYSRVKARPGLGYGVRGGYSIILYVHIGAGG